mgnify:CR=1 FL=1
MTVAVHFLIYLLEPVTLVGTIVSIVAGILGLVVFYRAEHE